MPSPGILGKAANTFNAADPAHHPASQPESLTSEDPTDSDEERVSLSPRRWARILALKALFEGDLVRHDPVLVVDRLIDEDSPGRNVESYARRLVVGVVRGQSDIDREIVDAAPAWPIEQMPSIDKSLLRLAIHELIHDNSHVPAKAAINEAVEIAKDFGSESSSRFVNGVLGTILARKQNRASRSRDVDSTETASDVPPVADR